MPLCLGALGSVRASSAPHCEYCARGGPDLLAGDAPAAVDLGGLGGQAGQVGTGARLGKQLAPDHFAAERRRQEPLLLLVGAERDDRRNDPRRDAHLRALHLAGRELLGDDDLLDRVGRAPPRLGQVRLHPAALGDRGVALLARNRLERGDFRADLLAQLLGLRVEVDVELAHSGAGRDVDHLLRVVGGAAEAGGEHQRAAVVDVGVVLPGEADAAVHLDAVLGAVLRGGGRQRRGDRGGELESAVFRTVFACLVDGAGGVPHRRGGPLGVGDHLGALVLDGLELPDRPAELLADLGVRRGGVGGPARDADRLGGQQRRHQRTRERSGSGCSARGRRRPRRRWRAHGPPAAAGRRSRRARSPAARRRAPPTLRRCRSPPAAPAPTPARPREPHAPRRG